MPVDTSKLNATIQRLTDEVSRTEGTEDSAGKLIQGFSDAIKTAVADALTADAAANQGSIDAANDAIDQVTARFSAADDKLGAAVAAGSGGTTGGTTGGGNPPLPGDGGAIPPPPGAKRS